MTTLEQRKLRVLGQMVLLEQQRQELKTPSGLHLAWQYQDNVMIYKVLAVGPKADPEVKPGMKCLVPYLGENIGWQDGPFGEKRVLAKSDQIAMVWQ